MKSSIKSQSVDYDHLYNVLLLAIDFFLLYIGIRFFLPLSNYISFFFFGLSSFSLFLYWIQKKRLPLILAFISTLLAIVVFLANNYL